MSFDSRCFVYWFQGFFEISEKEAMTESQVERVKEKLQNLLLIKHGEETMTSKDFACWLKGFFDISEEKTLSEKQVQIIKNHLSMVFIHEIDPSYGNEEHQKVLNAIHNHKDVLYRC